MDLFAIFRTSKQIILTVYIHPVAGASIPTVVIALVICRNTLDVLLKDNVCFPVVNYQPNTADREAEDLRSGRASGRSGPRLNIKTVLSTYGDFHVKDKTAVRTSYL